MSEMVISELHSVFGSTNGMVWQRPNSGVLFSKGELMNGGCTEVKRATARKSDLQSSGDVWEA